MKSRLTLTFRLFNTEIPLLGISEENQSYVKYLHTRMSMAAFLTGVKNQKSARSMSESQRQGTESGDRLR